MQAIYRDVFHDSAEQCKNRVAVPLKKLEMPKEAGQSLRIFARSCLPT